MNRKTITVDGVSITVTEHDENDYDIYFDDIDCSVRGTMLDVVRSFAEWQQEAEFPAVWFDFEGQAITNPWIDSSARFPLDTVDASVYYGAENVMRFIMDACSLLRPSEGVRE